MKRGFYLLIFLIGIGACSPKNLNRQVLLITDFSNHVSDSLSMVASYLPQLKIETFENYLELTWETASEDSINLFEIERAIDTMEFKSIARLEPFGSKAGGNYLEVDKDLVYNQILKYRLKVFREDDIVYSDVIEIFLEKPVEKISLLLHPTKNKKYIHFSGSIKSSGFLNLYFSDGSLAIRQEVKIKEGYNEVEIPFRNQPNGVYFLQFKAPSKEWTTRLLNLKV